jgi:hypothetical protein
MRPGEVLAPVIRLACLFGPVMAPQLHSIVVADRNCELEARGGSMSRFRVLIPLLMTGCVVAWPQQRPAEDKTMSPPAMSGQELFQVYCAA